MSAVGVKSFKELAIRFAALLGLSVAADKAGDKIFGSSEDDTKEAVNDYLRDLEEIGDRGVRVKRCAVSPCSDSWYFVFDRLINASYR